MALTLQECIDAVKKEYPNHYPYAFVELEGVYIFSIIPKGVPANKAISDMHIVDPKSGDVSGGISIMELLQNPKFREAWKKPNMVSNHDEALHHSSFFNSASSSVRNWGIKKTVSYATSDYLEHYGITGQKWGVRNGPPYPLDKKSHDKVVSGNNQNGSTNKRAGLIQELALTAYALTLIGLRVYMKSPAYKNKLQKNIDVRNRNLSKDLISDIADVDKKFSNDNMPKKIDGEHSVESDMAAANPHYNGGVIPGTSVNCTLCTVAYDMRRRGYDVTALASDSGTYVEAMLPRIYDGAKEDKLSARNWTDFYDAAAKKYPEGSRGEIHVSGPFMAHSMAWEIRNGKFEILDAQRNVKVKPEDLAKLGFQPFNRGNGFYRLDNHTIKPENMHYACAELKSDWKKTIAESNSKSNTDDTSERKISESERRRNYEELWKKEHPDALNNFNSREAMDNWVDAHINR